MRAVKIYKDVGRTQGPELSGDTGTARTLFLGLQKAS